MQAKILLIDSVKKHRQVVRNFLAQSQPDLELTELDPATDPVGNIEWSQYYLLIIDNQLGDEDGIEWVKQHQQQTGFPRVIFLSSDLDPDSLESSIKSDEGKSLGAEAYLFKKSLKADKLNYYVKSALEKSGAYSPLVIEGYMFDEQGATDDDHEEVQEQVTQEEIPEDPDVASTYHQMWYAKALLQGHENWPFKIQDMLAGNVKIGDYSIDTYLGCRDRVFSFSAHDIKDDKPYAIKLFDRSTTLGRKPPDNLKKDLQTLIANKNPNLVRWIAFQAIEDYVIMVQEYLVGKKLAKLLDKTGVTREQAIDIMLQILSGLEVLHDNDMTAGAYSPDNILFRTPKTLVLTHLNNVYYPVENQHNSGLKFNYSEALYMSPEAIQERQTDHRSDLYVAGTIFYHMLAGNPPYHGSRTQDVATGHIASPVPDLPNKDDPFKSIIQGLLMKTPGKRIQSVDEVRGMIEGVSGN